MRYRVFRGCTQEGNKVSTRGVDSLLVVRQLARDEVVLECGVKRRFVSGQRTQTSASTLKAVLTQHSPGIQPDRGRKFTQKSLR